MANPKKPTTPEAEKPYIPTDEEILRELKQREKRKEYMHSEKALVNRKKYMKKRYEETKARRTAIEDLKKSDPAKYAELMKRAQAELATKK